MTDPRVIIFGGSPYQLHQVSELIMGVWPISVFPVGHLLREADIHPPPGLILFIQNGPFTESRPFLEAVRQSLSHVPVILIAEEPDREDIIQAFRFGVRDCLLFPLQADEFMRAVKEHWKVANSPVSIPLLVKWKKKLSSWMGIRGRYRGAFAASALESKAGRFKEFSGFPFSPTGEEPARHDVDARFFGNFQLMVKGKEVPLLPGEKVNALFAFLLYHHRKPVHREILLSRFWEYNTPSAARKSLNVAMHTLRQHLGGFVPEMEIIQYYNDNYSVSPELDLITDVDQFLGHWHKGRAVEASHGPYRALEYYQRAAALYQGDFLEDIHYEEWCELERDNLKEAYLALLDRLGTFFLQEQDCAMAEKVFKKMLEKDICLENIHRKLILCYYRLGRRDKAIRQYYKCAEALKKELHIEPSQPTRELFRLICEEKGISRLPA